MAHTMLRLPAVLERRGKKRSSHYNDIKRGLFTRPVSIGPRQRAWPEGEVETLNAVCIAGKTDDEIRVVVSRLEAARKASV